MDTTFSQPCAMQRYPHVLHSGACTVNHRATWGYRMECTACGVVEENPFCSSVTSEDGPRMFGYEHRDCAKVREPQDESMRLFSPAPTQIAGQLAMGA